MQVYDKEPSAAAVVLCSLAYVYCQFGSDGFKIIYEIKKRVKVLSPNGTDEANVSITYFSPESSRELRETISSLKATAWNMEGGKLQKVKMAKCK